MKQCSRCKKILSNINFYKDKNQRDKLCCQCKKCFSIYYKNNKEIIRKRHKKYNETHKLENAQRIKNYNLKNRKKYLERLRKYDLEFKYGITLDSYNLLFKQQKGLCVICKKKEKLKHHKKIKNLSVDHNHKTGKVRGLLCNDCNHGLGQFKENIKFLKNAINYLIERK